MQVETRIVLEELYMSFEMKDNKLYFELDEPDDKNLTFTIKNKFILEKPNGLPKTFDHSEGSLYLDYGSYIFIFHTTKCKKISIEYYKNKFQIWDISDFSSDLDLLL